MLDFMFSQRRNKPIVNKFVTRMMEINGLSRKIVIDESSANTADIKTIDKMLKGFGSPKPTEMAGFKYLNNIAGQNH